MHDRFLFKILRLTVPEPQYVAESPRGRDQISRLSPDHVLASQGPLDRHLVGARSASPDALVKSKRLVKLPKLTLLSECGLHKRLFCLVPGFWLYISRRFMEMKPVNRVVKASAMMPMAVYYFLAL